MEMVRDALDLNYLDKYRDGVPYRGAK